MAEVNILKQMGPVALAMLIAGCASSHSLTPNPFVPKSEYITAPSKVAVVTSSSLPAIKVEGLDGWSEIPLQAIRAAVGGCFSYVGAPSGTIDGRPVCDSCGGGGGGGGAGGEALALVAATLLLTSTACTVVAAPVIAMANAAVAPSAQEIQVTKESLSSPLSAQAIQGALRDNFMAAARANGRSFESVSSAQANDLHALASIGIDTVLEIAITDVSLKGGGINPPLALTMAAHARIIRTLSNVEIFADDYYYRGEYLKLSEWSANRAERLTHGLEEGYKNLATNIYEYIFMLYPYPDREFRSHAFGLAAIAPGSKFGYATVDSLQPTLRWESFPRPFDIKVATKDMARVKDVRYDLSVARNLAPEPNEIVYRRNGLKRNEHKVEVALDPATHYTWSVRAHFELDGRERVTEWSLPVETATGHPYQFVTPQQMKLSRN